MRNFVIGFGVFAGIVMACDGGGGGKGGGPASDADLRAFCTVDCQRNIDCNQSTTPLAECTNECVTSSSGWVRADAVDDIHDCEVALTCTQDEDMCIDMIQPLPIHREWETKCRSSLATCVQMPSDLDSLCEVDPNTGGGGDAGFVRLFATPVMNDLLACLDLADCEMKQTCINDVATRYHIDG